MIPRKLIFLCVVLINMSFSKGFRTIEINGIETIFAMEDEMINIQCKTDMPMAYCGFIHPNGKRYSFSGSTLNAGQCAIEIKAAVTDSGEWRCHIGSEGAIGVEIIQHIHVRVVEELAALQKNITAVHGKPVTIACMTTKGLTSLKYCRFEPPNDSPFSINSDVNVTRPILGRYYFPPNKSVDRGDCAVTIRKVKYEDVGTWTCGVGMDDGKGYIDTITLEVDGLFTISTASATGITFGVIIFLGILGFVVWKKRRFLGSSPAEAEEQELEQLRHVEIIERVITPRQSPHPSPLMSHVPLRTSHVSLRASPRGSLKESHVSVRASSLDQLEDPSQITQRASLHNTPTKSPQVSRKSRDVSPKSVTSLAHGSHSGADVPEIVLQSPSDTGSILSE